MSNSVSSFEKGFVARLSQLVNVPQAYPFEAPSSWVCRAAALQGCSHLEFLQLLGVGWSGDLDLRFALAFPSGVPAVPEVAELDFARKLLLRLLGSKSDHRRFLLYGHGSRARYRYCGHCMKENAAIYLPLHGRFAAMRVCPWHLCLLEDECPDCKAAVLLPKSLISAGPRSLGVEDLSRCLVCSKPLFSLPPIYIDHHMMTNSLEWWPTWMRNGRAVIAALNVNGLSFMGRNKSLSYLRHLDLKGLLPNSPAVLCTKDLRADPGVLRKYLSVEGGWAQ